ncbi:MAG: aminoacyl-tRNA hydrolase [Bacilli bacterium]|nr:aminoacyl-tRNA hydrolase [Bacilli bacterium]
MKLIIGLGNPGKEYENTRHNMGFIVLDSFAKSLGVSIDKKKFNGLYADLFVDGEKVLLVKPQSYMNLSGEVVQSFANYYDVDYSDILVISDDLDLDFLDYRLRLFGSSGGHNGLQNIEDSLGSNRFRRFRIGISNNPDIDTKDYVLGKFSKDDIKCIDEFLPKTVDILNDFIRLDFEKVMSKYN